MISHPRVCSCISSVNSAAFFGLVLQIWAYLSTSCISHSHWRFCSQYKFHSSHFSWLALQCNCLQIGTHYVTTICMYHISANKRRTQIKDRAQKIDLCSGGLEISRPCLNRRSSLLSELIVCTCTIYCAMLTLCTHIAAMAGMRNKYTINFKLHTVLLADIATTVKRL